MKERDKNRFYTAKIPEESIGIRDRADAHYIQGELLKSFPCENLVVQSVKINESGKFTRFPIRIKGLPSFVSISIAHSTGKHTEIITVWSPLCWNDRFIGTAGGGTSTGGKWHITKPDNTSRGMTLPKAILNGFTAATTDAANRKHKWALDKKTGKLDWERIENWRAQSTHFMTLVGKATAQILHLRPVIYSYFHGGSGGGRQALVEAQEYADDYDGIWASCPAINWTGFVLCGLWPIAVMNSYNHILTHRKIKYFMTEVHNSVGGPEKFYKLSGRVDFDPYTLIGNRTKSGEITRKDAEIMQKIWLGPHRENGELLWYGFWPGTRFWNVSIPIGAFYYSLVLKRPKPFIISAGYAQWVTENPKQKFTGIKISEYYELHDKSISKFADIAGDKTDLHPFKKSGGKLIIDHGTDDPLIPVDGTPDYYRRLCSSMGGKSELDTFIKMYITPGDGHGNCRGNGPGITESDGMTALISWVEKGITPKDIRVVRVDKRGNTLEELTQAPY